MKRVEEKVDVKVQELLNIMSRSVKELKILAEDGFVDIESGFVCECVRVCVCVCVSVCVRERERACLSCRYLSLYICRCCLSASVMQY
jgi:hypothetical protein